MVLATKTVQRTPDSWPFLLKTFWVAHRLCVPSFERASLCVQNYKFLVLIYEHENLCASHSLNCLPMGEGRHTAGIEVGTGDKDKCHSLRLETS